jgi:hypothetical protein
LIDTGKDITAWLAMRQVYKGGTRPQVAMRRLRLGYDKYRGKIGVLDVAA